MFMDFEYYQARLRLSVAYAEMTNAMWQDLQTSHGLADAQGIY